MTRSTILRVKLLFLGVSLSVAASLLTGCNNASKPADNGAGKKSSTSVPKNKGANVQEMGLTLPVLDALFFEEGFEQELKSKLQLSDEQIKKLKTASRESVAALTEDGAADYTGSARNAAQQSQAQLKSILGDEKAAQLSQLISQRYASGDVEGLMPTQPNSIPTDTRIVVNAPAYRMDVYQDGKLLKTYRVGIGYPEFPLPTGMRRAENIIFNPTWTPPDEPWVKGKVQAGKKVAADSKLNPLGPIKIPIGLPSLIHGGKAVAKLGTFASHGCVGLTNEQVQDFAGVLSQLSGSGLSADSIQSFEQRKTQTKSVKLTKPVPVELRYETIVAENGGLHIYRDVYERGSNTRENADGVLAVYNLKYDNLSATEKAALDQALAQMNADAKGNTVTDDTTGKEGVATTEARAKKGKVTRTIVGQKDILVPIAALQGKGYPAPVNYNTGAEAAPVAMKK